MTTNAVGRAGAASLKRTNAAVPSNEKPGAAGLDSKDVFQAKPDPARWLPDPSTAREEIGAADLKRIDQFLEKMEKRGVTKDELKQAYGVLSNWKTSGAEHKATLATLRKAFELPAGTELKLKQHDDGSAISGLMGGGTIEGLIRMPESENQSLAFEANVFDGLLMIGGPSTLKSVGSDPTNKYDRKIVAGIVSVGTPWEGSPIAELFFAHVAGLVLHGEEAVHDLKPEVVKKFIADHKIEAPRFGVAGNKGKGGLAGECSAGHLLLKAVGFVEQNKHILTNDGAVPLGSALPEGVTPMGVFADDHYGLVRDRTLAEQMAEDVKKQFPGAPAPFVCLVNGLTGGHHAAPGVLEELVSAFGPENVAILPTNELNEEDNSVLQLKNGREEVAKIPVLGKRGLLKAGMDSLDEQSEYIAAKVKYLESTGAIKPGQKVLLVGHSMGGLASYGATFLLEQGLEKMPKGE